MPRSWRAWTEGLRRPDGPLYLAWNMTCSNQRLEWLCLRAWNMTCSDQRPNPVFFVVWNMSKFQPAPETVETAGSGVARNM